VRKLDREKPGNGIEIIFVFIDNAKEVVLLGLRIVER
jgi:hypothetical protein